MILRFATRNLLKRPFLNAIKVLGLSLALSSLLMILLFLKYELSFDRYHSNSDRIYRLTTTSPSFFNGKHFARVFRPSYLPEMAESFAGIENYVRLAPMRGGVLRYEKKFHTLNQAFICDSTFFQVFDARLVQGNRDLVLEAPGSMVLTESFARKVFGDKNPLGEILTLPSGQFYGEDIDYTVTGIMVDFPRRSHFHPELITTPNDPSVFNAWGWTYLLMQEKADPSSVVDGFSEFYYNFFDTSAEEFEVAAHLQKITDIHLHSRKTREIEANSNMAVIWSFSAAAVLLLIIALINYANLGIGMSGYSEKYLFIGKVFGSPDGMRFRYFFTEGILIAGMSILLGGAFSFLVSMLIQTRFSLNLMEGNLGYSLLVALLFILLAVMAGILPLVRQFIRRIRTMTDVNSGIIYKKKGVSRGLIVAQFTISIALIVAVFVIHRQTVFALENSLGKEDPNLICLPNIHTELQSHFPQFKEELLRHSSIEFVSAMLEAPGDDNNDMFRFTMEGYVSDESETNADMINIYPCDYSFASLFGLEFLAGDNFSEDNEDHEGSGEYLINETAMRRLNHNNPAEIVGKEFDLIFGDTSIVIPSGRIIGVVKDFHLSNIKKKVEPMVMFKRDKLWLINFLILPGEGSREQALEALEAVWEDMFPQYPLHYEYVDAMYRDVYSTELLQARLLAVFTFIALFICSMGLLGMSLLTTQRRIKEIGIRRVNGAEAISIMAMLNWDFLKWIIFSFVLSVPLAWLAMDRWLESFVYRVPLSWWIFILAGLAAMLIALVTVSLQTWRASNKNPVEALRYE